MPSHNHSATQGIDGKNDFCFTLNRDTSTDATARSRVSAASSGNLYAMTSNQAASDSIGVNDITQSYVTGATGGSQPHNNLPPYLSVYIWLRTA